MSAEERQEVRVQHTELEAEILRLVRDSKKCVVDDVCQRLARGSVSNERREREREEEAIGRADVKIARAAAAWRKEKSEGDRRGEAAQRRSERRLGRGGWLRQAARNCAEQSRLRRRADPRGQRTRRKKSVGGQRVGEAVGREKERERGERERSVPRSRSLRGSSSSRAAISSSSSPSVPPSKYLHRISAKGQVQLQVQVEVHVHM